ncbi:hypothetical protein GCM10010112_26570 [Actinoplanes lobatus]|uniref:Dynamin family protein n=1 Tax=Actinoplanes lobatus TaxID=113568 RepID=A0A7W7MIR7_9ACTN|nr:hypothetical protein [Actinoplanes lobatus]MBB4751698.1 hypothetical protein [Actinoplanes lobatus]GGN65327.1 hypothetical protein GCM10010112_26570 [Actinoplanes lobatus]GIE43281.1 hypothetical protein Alo02nite_61790 [Actinoplanes lobatus]
MKSTTLALLLGRRSVLRIGTGSVTAAPTELRLVQGDRPTGAGSVQMLTETEATARARDLLGLGVDDTRTLTELATVDHRNQPLLAGMVHSAELFGFGTRHDLETYLTSCEKAGGDRIGDFGAPLIQRIEIDVPVPAEVWDLSWARGRAVTLVDLPGTGEGRALENLFRDRQQELAHIALNIVAVTGGSSFTPPVLRGSPNCVFVATKIDRVEQPEHPNEVRTIEAAVAECLAEWRIGSRRARVAAVSGMWAFADEASWREFDPENPTWHEAQAKRAAWAAAGWSDPGATAGEFRAAVEAALADGGSRRLRDLIEELADPGDARIDEMEEQRLLARADELIEQVLAGDAATVIGDVVVLLDRSEKDPEPVYDLRRVAEEHAVTAIYDRPEWETIRRLFRADGSLRVPLEDVRTLLAAIDLGEVAGAVIRDATTEMDDVLRDWARPYLDAVHADAGQLSGTRAGKTTGDPAGRFVELSRGLFRVLTDSRRVDLGDGRAPAPSSFTFQQVARVRDELALLLARILIDLLKPATELARTEVHDALSKPAARGAADTVQRQLRRVQTTLRTMAPRRAST